jgi:hypothetical protein
MIFSLLLPMIASIIVGAVGISYGVFACRRLFKQIQALRSEGARLPYMSFTSLIKCWLHVLLFRPVEWKTDLFMWFALSPYLGSRALGHKIKPASENWSALRTALRSKFAERRVVGAMQRPRKIHPMRFSYYDVKELQGILHGADLDVTFASVVFKGRKFASGVFSILVLFFVGSLTSSIGALLCEPRDDSMYLLQDPTIECNYSSPRYNGLVTIAVFALVLYVVVVPAFVIILLRSQWSKDMRTGDRNGYDALFGFLTSRYNLTCYMWESVMFVYKGFGVLIPAVYSGSPLQQSVGMMFVSLVYVVLLFKFSPFANSLLNAVEKSAAFSIFLMYFTGVIFVCEVDGKPILDKAQKAAVAVLLIVICGASLIFCFLAAIYEYCFTLLFHGDMFVSKWMRAFQSAIGDSLNESLFLYFYAFYNPKSRKNLVEKKRILNESIAVLMSVKHSQAWKKGSLWVRFKMFCSTMWQWIRFGVKNRNLAECQPMVVHEALQYPEARLFQRLSKIMHHHTYTKPQQSPRSPDNEEKLPVEAEGKWSSLRMKVRGFCRRAVAFWKNLNNEAKSASEIPPVLTELDPPVDFMTMFSGKYRFMCGFLSPEALGVLLTILVFDQQYDMGDSSEAQAYLQQLKHEIEPLKKSLRSIYSVVHDVIEEEERVQQKESWIVRQLKTILLGEEGACLYRFVTFSSQDVGHLFEGNDFEDFSKDEMRVIPVPQLVAAQIQMSNQAGSLQTFVQKIRKNKKNVVADVVRAVNTAKAKPVLHHRLFLQNVEVPQAPSTFALTLQRMRPQIYASKKWRSAVDKSAAAAATDARGATQPATTGAGIISLANSFKINRKLVKNELADSGATEVRGVAELLHLSDFDSADELSSMQQTPSAESKVFIDAPAAAQPSSSSLESSGDPWELKAAALGNELSAFKAFYERQTIDQDTKVASLEKKNEELVNQLARSNVAEAKLKRDLENMPEELKSLRAMIRTLQTSKDGELEQLQKQFAYDLSLKNAELHSKDVQLKSVDDDLQGLRTAIEAEPDEQFLRFASGLSLKSLRDVVVSATERRSAHRELVKGGESAEAFAAAALKARTTRERQLQSSFDAAAADAAELLVKQRLQAKEAAVANNVAASSASAAVAAETQRKGALMAAAAVAAARRELESGKQKGSGVDHV